MYERFAEVYDALMDDFDYPAWADYYMELIRRAGGNPKRMAECGCGTGSMTVEFADMGVKVTGMDLSAEMLRIAQVKARRAGQQVVFVEQDMRELAVPRAVDTVVCACDGVNYLTAAQDVRMFFDAAFSALKAGGVLAFDVSTGAKLLEMPGNVFAEDRDEVTWLWFTEAEDDRRVRMDIAFFLRDADGRYERFDEEQLQRAHTAEELKEWLGAAGFEDVRLYGDRTFDAPQPGEKRMHITARKPK